MRISAPSWTSHNLAPGETVRMLRDKGQFRRESWLAHHAHRVVEIQYIKQGRGAYFIGGKHVPFGRNTLLIVPPHTVHGFMPDKDSPIDKFGLMFPLAYLDHIRRGARCLTQLRMQVVLTEGEGGRVEMIFHQILTEQDNKAPYWTDIVKEMIRELVFLIIRAGERPASTTPPNPPLAAVLRHIEEHFAEPICIKKLADMTGFSVRHLSRIFKTHTGASIKQYIQHRRIIEAQRLILETPALKLTAIAEKIGFENYHVFHRAFKLTTGMTPASYTPA